MKMNLPLKYSLQEEGFALKTGMLQVLQTVHVQASVCIFESGELMFGAVKGLTHFGFILIDFVQGLFCVRKYPS